MRVEQLARLSTWKDNAYPQSYDELIVSWSLMKYSWTENTAICPIYSMSRNHADASKLRQEPYADECQCEMVRCLAGRRSSFACNLIKLSIRASK